MKKSLAVIIAVPFLVYGLSAVAATPFPYYCPQTVTCTTDSLASCKPSNDNGNWKFSSASGPRSQKGATYYFVAAHDARGAHCDYFTKNGAFNYQLKTNTLKRLDNKSSKWVAGHSGNAGYTCGDAVSRQRGTQITECPFQKR